MLDRRMVLSSMDPGSPALGPPRAPRRAGLSFHYTESSFSKNEKERQAGTRRPRGAPRPLDRGWQEDGKGRYGAARRPRIRRASAGLARCLPYSAQISPTRATSSALLLASRVLSKRILSSIPL